MQKNADNIKAHIQVLENYVTRHHTTAKVQTAVQDLKTKRQNLITASRRTVRIVNHTGTPMPSLVFTINYCARWFHYCRCAYGFYYQYYEQCAVADGDASGIATITKMIGILLDVNYKSAKTVKFMAFAAEEIGLLVRLKLHRIMHLIIKM